MIIKKIRDTPSRYDGKKFTFKRKLYKCHGKEQEAWHFYQEKDNIFSSFVGGVGNNRQNLEEALNRYVQFNENHYHRKTFIELKLSSPIDFMIVLMDVSIEGKDFTSIYVKF